MRWPSRWSITHPCNCGSLQQDDTAQNQHPHNVKMSLVTCSLSAIVPRRRTRRRRAADKAAKCNMLFLYQRFVYMAWQADSEEAGPLLEELNIEVLPTVQFWKAGQLLWEHRGIVALQQDLGEGAAFHSFPA